MVNSMPDIVCAGGTHVNRKNTLPGSGGSGSRLVLRDLLPRRFPGKLFDGGPRDQSAAADELARQFPGTKQIANRALTDVKQRRSLPFREQERGGRNPVNSS